MTINELAARSAARANFRGMDAWIRRGRSLLGALGLCMGAVGCAAQHDDALRLSEELGRARADAAWNQARANELESRLARLEQRAAAQSTSSPEEHALVRHLDRLLEMNERLLAERSAAPAPSPATPASAPPPHPNTPPASAASSAATVATTATVLSDEQQLRALVERLRGHAGSPHGGLTREQENALRVLIRPERALDTENPWPAAFY